MSIRNGPAVAEARRPASVAPFRVPKAAELVASHLRSQIVRGELVEGDMLPPEPQLMAQFQVSRPTLREAFRILESESLITIRRGARGGAVVHSLSATTAARYAGLLLQARGTTIADVYECRTIVEPAAARMLASRPTKAAVSRLRTALAEQEAVADDPRAFPIAAARFHEEMVGLSGNNTLGVLAGMLHEIIELHAAAVTAPPPREVADAALKVHAHLIELVEAKRPDDAEAFWRRHLQEAAESMLKGVGARKVLDLLP